MRYPVMSMGIQAMVLGLKRAIKIRRFKTNHREKQDSYFYKVQGSVHVFIRIDVKTNVKSRR